MKRILPYVVSAAFYFLGCTGHVDEDTKDCQDTVCERQAEIDLLKGLYPRCGNALERWCNGEEIDADTEDYCFDKMCHSQTAQDILYDSPACLEDFDL